MAHPPAGTLAHQWHVWTEDWWRLRRPYFDCSISSEVLRAAAAGDPKSSQQRLEILSTLAVLCRKEPLDELVEAVLSADVLSAKAKADGMHLAIATIYRMSYLLTWNCRHLANAQILRRLQRVAKQFGHHMPVVCTPLQLMGAIEYED